MWLEIASLMSRNCFDLLLAEPVEEAGANGFHVAGGAFSITPRLRR